VRAIASSDLTGQIASIAGYQNCGRPSVASTGCNIARRDRRHRRGAL